MSFNTAFVKTVGLEGGFDDDSEDSGNWTGGKIGVGELKGTKYGISAAAYPSEDIKNLTLDRAKELYKRDYWDPLKLNEIYSSNIQEEIFDTGVNMGIGSSALILQKSINYLEIGNPVDEDSSIGSQTLTYANKWCSKDPYVFFKVLNGFQFMRYVEITKANTVKEKFAYGWMKRIQDYKEV